MGQTRMDNPEKLTTLGTQDTGRSKKKKSTLKAKEMSNLDPTKNPG
jgi:hypothetical protein